MTARSTTARPAPTTSLKQLLTGHPLVAFFVLAFAGSWLIELPFILGQQGIGLFPYTLSTNWLWLMPFTGPTLAALMMTAVLDGKAGVRALLRRLIQWRVGLRWYLLALFGPPLILLAGASGMFGIGSAEALIQHWPLIFSDYLVVVPIILILGLVHWAKSPAGADSRCRACSCSTAPRRAHSSSACCMASGTRPCS